MAQRFGNTNEDLRPLSKLAVNTNKVLSTLDIEDIPLCLPENNIYYISISGKNLEIYSDSGISEFQYNGQAKYEHSRSQIKIYAGSYNITLHQNSGGFSKANFKPIEEYLAPVTLMEEFVRESDPLKRRELIKQIRRDFQKSDPEVRRISSIPSTSGESGFRSVRSG